MTIRRSRRSGLALLCLSFGTAGLLSAQPMSPETPPDSPLWWTLTPDLTPEELRAAYLDPEGSKARYQQAVEAELEPPLSDEGMAQLVWYDNPSLTPHLVPMWLAFNTLATISLERKGEEALDFELAAFSISEDARKTILKAASRLAAEEADEIAKVGPKQVKLAKLQQKAIEKGHAKSAVDRASKLKDKQFFSSVSSESPEELESLLAVYDANPPAEASERALARMRKHLTDADWEQLRRYLLEVIVPATGPATDLG